jgi:hypothetical protein
LPKRAPKGGREGQRTGTGDDPRAATGKLSWFWWILQSGWSISGGKDIRLEKFLQASRVACHPLIIGELALRQPEEPGRNPMAAEGAPGGGQSRGPGSPLVYRGSGAHGEGIGIH